MSNHPIIVQKYGGVCLETPAKIRAVARSLADLHGRGHRVVAIVSAMGKTTDQLIQMAYQVSPAPNRRELDMLLTTGERISMSLMSMALSDLGVPAISFTGSQAGVMTDDSHSSARILDVRPIRVREELDRGRVVELAQSQDVPLVLKQWGSVKNSTQVMKEVAGMENGKVLAVNSMARIEHVEIDSKDLNHGFEKFAQHLKQNSLSWPQLLASSFTAGKTSMTVACDSEWLDALLRTLERSKDLRKQREASSSVSLTCFGGVSSELPFRALQVLGHHGIVPDMYVLSPHSFSLFVPVENREAAVKALHSLVQQT